MKALVKAKAERGLWLKDVPEPEMGINDVLIKIHKTGICGTDLHIYRWDEWSQKTVPVPMVIGHEFVGEIVDRGSNVKDFHVGDIVPQSIVSRCDHVHTDLMIRILLEPSRQPHIGCSIQVPSHQDRKLFSVLDRLFDPIS